MRQSNKSKWFFGILVAFGLFFVFSVSASAQTIAYHPLRYGTNQTSMADGYFVKPANVVVKNHLYYVTMQIRTAKSLSSFPVKVNWVNGKAPLNVRRIKDRAGNSHMYYSFYTNNLRKRINAKLAIDVPKVYKAHHLISFKFSTVGLPSLGRTHKVATHKATRASVHKAVTSSSVTKPKQSISSKKPVAASKQVKKAAKTKKQSQNQQKAKQASPKKESSQPSQASSNLTKPAKKDSSKPQTKKSGVPWIVGGVTVIAGLSAALWIYFKH